MPRCGRTKSLQEKLKSSQGEIPEHVEIELNGLRWRVSLEHGQKTGIYLDQRENYRAAARYASGRALWIALHRRAGLRCIWLNRASTWKGSIRATRQSPPLEANAELNGIRQC